MNAGQPKGRRVGLMATCLVDLFRPSVGFAAAKLLEDAGCSVDVPSQTCCGQPAYNSGDKADARALALQVIDAFEGYDYVVAPSGSCAGMMAKHYPELFEDDPELQRRARKFADAGARAAGRQRRRCAYGARGGHVADTRRRASGAG